MNDPAQIILEILLYPKARIGSVDRCDIFRPDAFDAIANDVDADTGGAGRDLRLLVARERPQSNSITVA